MFQIHKKFIKNSFLLFIGLFLVIFLSGRLGNGEFFNTKIAYGYGGVTLKIMDEKVVCLDGDSAQITWRTNMYADGLVVFGKTSNPSGSAPDYGYDSSVSESGGSSMMHSIVVDGLDPEEVYYFKPISNRLKGREVSVDMGLCQVIVKGEEGAPILTLKKITDTELANPGDKIEFLITVENIGNLSAFDVFLKDILPEELSFVEFEGGQKVWDLGDLKPGDKKEIKVNTIVSSDAEPGVYVNKSEVEASNYEKIIASDDYEIKNIAVLSETGFDPKELLLLIISLIFLSSSALYLRRKIS